MALTPTSTGEDARIRERVQRIIAEYLGIDAGVVYLGSKFQEDLGTDSLDEIELVMAIEDEFGIEITDEEMRACVTVQDAIDLVVRKQEN